MGSGRIFSGIIVVFFILALSLFCYYSYLSVRGRNSGYFASSDQSNIAVGQRSFADDTLGISFLYPAEWTVSSGINGGEGEKDWWELNIKKDNGFLLLATQQDNPQGLSPQKWFESHRGTYNKYFVRIASVNIDGSPAFIVTSPDSCQSAPMFVVFIQNQSKMLILDYYARASGPDAADLQEFLSHLYIGDIKDSANSIPSLVFPPVPSGLSCPDKTRYVQSPVYR